MSKTVCLVGNSSSGIREGAFIGTPVVNIGSRQNKRERGANVIDVDPDRDQILEAIRQQVRNGKYPSEPIYGNGNSGELIANTLFTVSPRLQKTITY